MAKTIEEYLISRIEMLEQENNRMQAMIIDLNSEMMEKANLIEYLKKVFDYQVKISSYDNKPYISSENCFKDKDVKELIKKLKLKEPADELGNTEQAQEQ